MNRRYYTHFAGRSIETVVQCARDWFRHVERQTNRLFYSAVVTRLRDHQARGEEPVFVSGSFPDLLAPVAERLGVRHVLATNQVVVDGHYTGEILSPQTIGEGKAEAAHHWLQQTGVSANHCYAYGDDISDVLMLHCVGHPVAVAGSNGLVDYAKARNWPVIQPG